MMQQPLSAGLGLVFLAIGAGALVAPRTAAGQFGIPVEELDALAWVRAAGARDIALGGTILASLGDPPALRRVLGWSALIGLADAANLVARHGLRPNVVIHLGGTIALALLARR